MASIDTFDGWRKHKSNTCRDTDLVVLDLLRNAHPGYHITRVSADDFDLHHFAAAEQATETLLQNANTYDGFRTFTVPGVNLDKQPGKLTDDIRFGRWSYVWKATNYIVYEIFYAGEGHGENQNYFILVPAVNERQLLATSHPVTDALLMAVGTWSQQLHEELWMFEHCRWTKSHSLYKGVQNATWDDVILDPGMKTNLMRDVHSFFDSRGLYVSLGVPWKRGVILHGVPGNGKTMSLKALINTLSKRTPAVPALYVKSLDAAQGPKHAISRIFWHARKMAPCLLVLEDLDSLVQEETRSFFLNEVDGLEANDGILIVGSTNHLSKLDDAITKRPSRFDRKYFFRVPGEAERVTYGHYWRKKLENNPAVDFPEELCTVFAQVTEGFSFAYLKELVISSLLALARAQHDEGREDDTADEQDLAASDTGSVVVVAAPTDDSATDQAAAEDGGGEKAEAPAPKPVMPAVEIPESLRDNLLTKIMMREAKVLWREMDNTDRKGEKNMGSDPTGVGIHPVGSRRGIYPLASLPLITQNYMSD